MRTDEQIMKDLNGVIGLRRYEKIQIELLCDIRRQLDTLTPKINVMVSDPNKLKDFLEQQ